MAASTLVGMAPCIQARNYLEFADSHRDYYEAVPAHASLVDDVAKYNSLINAVTGHAIRLSKGEINPPTVFNPKTLPEPLAVPEPPNLRRIAEDALQREVPDFRGCASWEDCVAIAQEKNVHVVDIKATVNPNVEFKVRETDPVAHQMIA